MKFSDDVAALKLQVRKVNYDNTHLINAMSGLKGSLSKSCWISQSNKYYNCFAGSEKIKDKIGAKLPLGSLIAENDFNQMICFTSFIHYQEGFFYLKSFLSSILSLDYKRAAHLLYYAELRWALSILASQGFVIIGSDIFISTQSGFQKIYSIGTSHKAIWATFTVWMGESAASDLMDKTFIYQSHNIGSWLRAGGASNASSSLSYMLMNKVTDNEVKFLTDRDFRNKVSYEAFSDFSKIDCKSASDTTSLFLKDIDFIFSLDDQIFSELDSEIIYLALRFSSGYKINHSKISAFVRKACKSLDKPDSLAERIIEKSKQETRIEKLFSEDANLNDEDSILYMLYRATLLMRLAASSNKILLSSATITSDELKDWFLDRVKNSPWVSAHISSDFYDLSEYSRLDYKECRDETSDDINGINNAKFSILELDSKIIANLMRLCSVETAAIWGLS